MLSPGFNNLENLPKDSINPTINYQIFIYLLMFVTHNNNSNYCTHNMLKEWHTIDKDSHIQPDNPQYNSSHTAHDSGIEANRLEVLTFRQLQNQYQKLFSLTGQLHFPIESFALLIY